MNILAKRLLISFSFLALVASATYAVGNPPDDNRIGKGDIQAMINAGFTGQDAHATHENGGYMHSAHEGFSRVEINFFDDGNAYCSEDYLALHIGWGYFNLDYGPITIKDQLQEYACVDMRWFMAPAGDPLVQVEDTEGPAKAVVDTAIGNAYGSWHGMVKPSYHIFEPGELALGTYDLLIQLWWVCGDEFEMTGGGIPSQFIVDDGAICD
jgi:hypothetical protein